MNPTTRFVKTQSEMRTRQWRKAEMAMLVISSCSFLPSVDLMLFFFNNSNVNFVFFHSFSSSNCNGSANGRAISRLRQSIIMAHFSRHCGWCGQRSITQEFVACNKPITNERTKLFHHKQTHTHNTHTASNSSSLPSSCRYFFIAKS